MGTSFGLISDAATNPFGLSGLAIGIIEGTVTFGGQTFLNIGALIQAIQRTSDVNVLIDPHLLTTDNQEAEIVVASNIPFVTATSQSQVSTLTSIERKDVGIILRFTPQVSEGDKVTLKIFEEISAIQATVAAGIDPAAKSAPRPRSARRRLPSSSIASRPSSSAVCSEMMRMRRCRKCPA